MIRNIIHLSSEDFRPKRLLCKEVSREALPVSSDSGDPMAAIDRAAADLPNSDAWSVPEAPGGPRSPEKTLRNQLAELENDVYASVRSMLRQKTDEIIPNGERLELQTNINVELANGRSGTGEFVKKIWGKGGGRGGSPNDMPLPCRRLFLKGRTLSRMGVLMGKLVQTR